MFKRIESVVWEFTLKCNLRCSHCGSSAEKARENELKTKECFKLCEDLANTGCKNICLMGGEPFLRNDWFSVGQSVKDLSMNLNFVTNGTILNKYIDELSRLEPKVIGMSLDGLEKTHDKIRGVKGSYRKVLDAVDLLRDRGIQTTLITTVSKINFKDLPEMKNLIFKKCVNWQIQIAMPFGNFKRENLLSKEEFYSVALFIAKQRIKTPFHDLPVIGTHCFGYYSKILPGDRSWKGCTAGISTIGVTSDGGIVGCLSMGNNRFIEGNIREKGLKEIWEDENNFAYNRKFTKEKLGPNCIECKHGIKCRGGCNSMSYSITNKLNNDPYCLYNIEKNM
jgi:radical SAM protein with 4Fe4S-binding SPASM domain